MTRNSLRISGKRLGKLAGQHLAAALQHRDTLARAGKPRRRDAAAVARADDHDVVARREQIERTSEARNGGGGVMRDPAS